MLAQVGHLWADLREKTWLGAVVVLGREGCLVGGRWRSAKDLTEDVSATKLFQSEGTAFPGYRNLDFELLIVCEVPKEV